ncbi:MAG: cation diffusion facilitator family transporter [Firmicutes bacterium]|nr:cation diffusion facilitator family transporter [Bacillota bacterium]
MTALLLRLFGADGDRGRIGKLAGFVGMVCNAMLFAVKLAVGTLTGSVSVTADAMNNLSDSTSSLVTLLGFRLAERPADEEHPYGHARYEYLSGLAVAVLILVIGVELLRSSFLKILSPETTAFTPVMFFLLALSVGVKLWMYFFNRSLGRRIDSETLLATADDARNDCITTSAVILAAVVEYFTAWKIDGWAGCAVAIFILISGVQTARDTISPLLGEGADSTMQRDITALLRSEPRILGIHDLMVHDYGPGRRFASVHVEMNAKDDPMESHDRIDALERQCLQTLQIHLVIHYDPVITDDEELNRQRRIVESALAKLDSRITVHDFRRIQSAAVGKLIFDVALPFDLRGREAYVTQAVQEAVGDKYLPMITFDVQ